MKKIIGIFIFSWCVAFVFAQRPAVRLEVSTSSPQVGQNLTITVKANVQGQLEVDLPKSFQSGNSTMSSMQQEIDYNSGEVVTYFIHSQNGSFTRSGNYTVGPAIIRKGSKVFKSNVINVTVKQEQSSPSTSESFSKRQLSQPAFGIIQTSRSQIFEGEPLVVNGLIYSRFTPTHLEDYETYTIEGTADKHTLEDGSENIMMTEKNIGGVYMNTFQYDKQLLFPLSTGAPKTFTGGVGTFSTSCSAKTDNIGKGSIIELIFTVKGKGNLHQLNEPKLILSDAFAPYGDPEVKEDYSFGQDGASGKITYTYFVKILKTGALQLEGPGFSYFDPTKKQYVSVEAAQIELGNITEETSDEQDKNNASKDTFVSIKKDKKNTESISPLHWMLVVSGIALFLWFIYWLKFKKKKSEVSSIPTSHIKSSEEVAKGIVQEMETPERLLSKASAELNGGNQSQFIAYVEKALISALQKETGSSETNRNTLVEGLNEEHRKAEFRALFDAVDTAKYGSVLSNDTPEQLLAKVRTFISGDRA
ncbi:MAG: BatD family protein [Cryomorphaceae bacterium]|nr:BatD family protein [Cryomorphaceae bacterium]